MNTLKGVRFVALFEAFKGGLILLAGFGVLSLLHQDVQAIAEHIVSHFHLNPANHYPRIFLQLAEDMTNARLWLMACFAFAYAGLRLIEAYGLWFGRGWAEWLAVCSGGLYVPIEIYELASGFSWIKAATLLINVAIVIYIGRELQSRKPLP